MFNYRPQLPNINTPHEYCSRSIRHLAKGQLVEIDLSPISQGVLTFPGGALLNALVLSVRLNSLPVIPANIVEEDILQLYTRLFEHTGISDNIYDMVEELNRVTRIPYSLHRVASWKQVQLAIAEGLSVMIGGTVYESFVTALDTGVVPMPKPGEGLLGGHIVNLVSFDPVAETGIALANLGEDVGNKGKFTYRGSYFRNLAICSDFFVLVPGGVTHAN